MNWSIRLRRTWAAAVTAGLIAVPLAPGLAYADDGRAPGPRAEAAAPLAPGDFADLSDPKVVKELDKAIGKALRKTGVPGVIVGVWRPGEDQTYVKTFGVADKAKETPMTEDMYSRIGSVTKTFTVTAVLELVDQGRLDLDEPIGTYMSELPNGTKVPNADKVTIRQLAEMRSGLVSYTTENDFVDDLLSDPTRSFAPDELLDYAFKSDKPVIFEPGTRFNYSNTNLVLLGVLIEKITGQNAGDHITTNVIEKAGLKNTVFPTDAAFPTPHPQGYTEQTLSGKEEKSTDWNPSWGWTAGAMISKLEDLRTWATVVATGRTPDGTELVSEATQLERLKVLPTGIPGAGYGLGLFNVQGWIGHNGSLPGYEDLVMHLPDADATMVVILNTDIPADGHEPSTLIGQAITQVVSPGNVYFLPKPVTAGKPTPSGS
ncbi:beta-lactamase family protein [Streptomyces bambusae]|uniref:serine hydrolase domain-containing protein n=1 Tax=Streptomyces bambusae TaxID=1550616 RepID=UPI001CFED778|nr:serine hydrolase domain-containing protein [Streptomyces bambusae]MCB5165202.1 beta-lactamase family protein [Streptomyces bambusae]